MNQCNCGLADGHTKDCAIRKNWLGQKNKLPPKKAKNKCRDCAYSSRVIKWWFQCGLRPWRIIDRTTRCESTPFPGNSLACDKFKKVNSGYGRWDKFFHGF